MTRTLRPRAAPAGPDISSDLAVFQLAVDVMEQALLVHDGYTILLSNARIGDLLGYPPELFEVGASTDRFIEFGASRGDYDGGATLALPQMREKMHRCEDYVTERIIPPDRIVRVDCRHRGGLAVVTYTDVTTARQAEESVAAAQVAAALSQRRLEEAIEALDDCFGLYDGDERLVLANSAYRALSPLVAPIMRPGTPYEALLRRAVETGFWPEDVLTKEEWVQKRLEVFREGDVDHVYKVEDGRWLLSRDRKLPGGERVSLRIDITTIKEREHELERSRKEIEELAQTDALTGLRNRRAFDENLMARTASASKANPLALILVDLDRFKPVNDTHGHPIGDALLQTLARRFRFTLRDDAVVARIGGDEFAILADVVDRADATALADRLRHAAMQEVSLDTVAVSVGASVGIAIAEGEKSGSDLLIAADKALYAAKAKGRDRCEIFDRALADENEQLLALEGELREALAADQFVLHYQPLHDLTTEEICGYEALIRWQHPKRGLLMPGAFVPQAEAIGLIDAIGRWVLERAARDFVNVSGGLSVSVNVSPLHLAMGDLVADVTEALRLSGLPPDRLEIEFTESALLSESCNVHAALDALRELGVRLVVDDFGTGYSSLAYLVKFPFSKIKIDQSFIEDMTDDRRAHDVIRSILNLSQALGVTVIAEGVETEAQLRQLVDDDCKAAQGYLLGRPEPIARIRPDQGQPG
ncbi:putative bifunctional diguanylate cyclase/phosphodiesterase [Aestuariibius sp. 2305UL40-4]|uniref:putative bifunctional diguanylate cyclase/phosphodiesterase n=1 Tax=Aestuariibius violaceus TaxID=3234132 RepID=UPI00345EF2A7